jgi:transcriptional regulator with XRE-family HTH domain
MAKTTNVLKILDKRDSQDPEMQALLLQAYIGSQLAQWVYDVRTQAGLTQKELADLIRTSQSAIARLEGADYTGHSLKVVTSIACALGKPLQIIVDPRRDRTRRPVLVSEAAGAPRRRKTPARRR